MKVTISDAVKYIGVDDKTIDLFESQYVVPEGVSYNSYLILDEKVALMESVDVRCMQEWEKNLTEALGGRKVDYLVIQHLEPDHAGSIGRLLELYPDVTLVGNAKTFAMLPQFFDIDPDVKKLTVAEGDTLSLGSHTLTFVMAPMVLWPEVMVSYESTEKLLFSADRFGKFGALDAEDEEGWACEARRYYFNIVGKYGVQVTNALKKASTLDISMLCPLHGPIWDEDINLMVEHTASWAAYKPEVKGVMIAYGSIYGGTANAAEILASKLSEKGIHNIKVYDVSKTDSSYILSESFKYSHLVFASASYNAGLFTPMQNLLIEIKEHLLQNRTCVLIENGTWAPSAKKTIKAILEPLSWNYIGEELTIKSRMKNADYEKIEALADVIVEDMNEEHQVKEEAPVRKWRCKICGYEYSGEELPENFICPLCKHPASDFEEITE